MEQTVDETKKWRRERETPLFLSKQPENKRDNLFFYIAFFVFHFVSHFLF